LSRFVPHLRKHCDDFVKFRSAQMAVGRTVPQSKA
jgi:hypothetical protein